MRDVLSVVTLAVPPYACGRRGREAASADVERLQFIDPLDEPADRAVDLTARPLHGPLELLRLSPERYERARRYAAQLTGERFAEMYQLAQADLAETEQQRGESGLGAYITAIYVRSLLGDEHLVRYFSDPAIDAAMTRVNARLESAIADLAAIR